MVDENATMLALRARALTLVAVTTGATSLSATATGYARAAGSFITDGFAVGMELLSSGFASNGYRVIKDVTATDITTTPAPSVEAAAGGRTLLVGLPEGRAFDNRKFTPIAGRPYVEEDFVPGAHSLLSFPAQGAIAEEDGLYIIKWYGLENTGSPGIRRPVNALKALFAPGTRVFANGVPVRVPGDASVKSGQILPQGNGWSVCVVTIPWMAETTNAVAP